VGHHVERRDGVRLGKKAPLQAIRDRYGNTVTIIRESGFSYGASYGWGKVVQVTSPNGRWLKFSYDWANRVSAVEDNIGRTVAYTYSGSELASVTDPEGNVTTYGWTGGRITSIEDGRGITYLTNTYTNGRVTEQTLADPGDTWELDYTVDGAGTVTQTHVTNPRGYVRRFTFNGDGYVLTDTEALDTAIEQTTTYEREAGSNIVTAITDELGRRTEFTHDADGYVLTATSLEVTAVSNGAGYAVTADSPERWHSLPVHPVIEAQTLPESSMIVFADYTCVCAYGPQGNMWTTRDISWDGLHIDHSDGRQLFVVAWDAPSQSHMTATIALNTGQVTGGPSPPAASTRSTG
jgi:YD repeat-containing protein